MRAMVFPGQGTQYVGMGKDFADVFQEAKETFEEIDDALSQHLSDLMFHGDESDLFSTENTQPALMAFSIAVLRVLEKQSGRDLKSMFSLTAGHSLGEYTACAASGFLNVSTTAKLLKCRGNAMKNAVEPFSGGMLAVIGSDIDTLKSLTNENCFIANDNAPSQTVLSGKNDALDQAREQALQKGAKRALKLNVSAPFHTPFMQPAADIVAEFLSQTDVFTPAIPVIGNASADVVKDVRQALIEQITHGVRWREIMRYFETHGITTLVEIGAGTVLKGLTKKNCPDMNAFSVNKPADVEVFLKTL